MCIVQQSFMWHADVLKTCSDIMVMLQLQQHSGDEILSVPFCAGKLLMLRVSEGRWASPL